MLILEKSISYDPVKLPVKYRGANIVLHIRPLDGEALAQISERAKVHKFAENPVTKKMELGCYVDDKLADLELFDHIVANIEGVGTSKTEPVSMTRENKAKVMNLKPGADDPRPLWKIAIEAASALARERHDALEAEIKNS